MAVRPNLTGRRAWPDAEPQPRPPENLKFFPKDTPRDTLLNIMRGFTYALGVNCAFCHVEEPATQPGGRITLPLHGATGYRVARDGRG